MDFDHYARTMLDYYTNRNDPSSDSDARRSADEYDKNFRTEGHRARELAQKLQHAMAGRDVLELASGSGQYARFIARTATSLLATDASPRALERLPEVIALDQDLPRDRFRTMELDAFHPERAPGMFSGAVVVNWFQHMPCELIDTWIARLHRKLATGSVVLIAINHLQPKSRAKLFSRPFDPNLYEARQTYDGRPADVIDNVFSEADLLRIFGPHAARIEYTCGIGYYWIVYELAAASRLG
jgi:demethylmenaquinone methyltransferase/2-methoxy-6-polyprenyl-1,4-benzoquinol methylase